MDHDRYLIYKFINKYVNAEVPRGLGGYKIKGIVKKAFRSIMNDRIELRINNTLYVFQEPTFIVENDAEICFVYGQETKETDDDIFNGLQDISLSGGNINDFLASTRRSPVKVIRFKISEK
jgi:hypothetical protein